MKANRTLLLSILMFAMALSTSAHRLRMSFYEPYRGTVKLIGYNGIQEKTLATKQLNGINLLNLEIPDDYRGIANLSFEAQGNMFLILNGEDIAVNVVNLADMSPAEFTSSNENQWLTQYVREQSIRQAKINGLSYLLPYYQNDDNDSLFSYMLAEYESVNQEERDFFASLPDDSYVAFYIPFRQYVEDQINAVRSKNKNGSLTDRFYTFDIASDDFWHSGIIEPFIEGQIALCELEGSQEAANACCKKIADHAYALLKGQSYKLLDMSEYLLAQFERRGLTEAAEYLSLTILNSADVTVEGDLAKKMEQYRSMKTGLIAPDINFKSMVYGEENLKSIETNKLLFFWKSGCPGCKDAIPDLITRQRLFKAYNIQVIGISMDTDNKTYDRYASQLPWENTSDLKGWDSPIVEDYFIYGTPVFYLLDQNNTILMKPRSMDELEGFVKKNLKKDSE